jgi:CBS domain-containing protein
MLTTNVSQVMEINPVTVGLETTLYKIAKFMNEENVGSVLVSDGHKKLLGFVTDRQIVIRAIAYERDPSTTTVKDIMIKWPMTISPETTCKEALDIMGANGYRRLPVEKDGELVGIVSISNLYSMVKFDDQCMMNMLKELSSDVRCK